MFRRLFLAIALLMHAPIVHAAPIGIDGFDPLITLGFNPQPEPPPEFNFTTSQVVNPFDVVAQVSGISPNPFMTTSPFSGVSPTPFLLTLAVSEGTLFPPEPIMPMNNMFNVDLRTGGDTLTLSFSLFFPDNSTLRTVYNSQESSPLRLSFNLIDVDGVEPDAVAVRMQVLQNGQALGLTAVPLPASVLLLGAALLGLGALRRKV